MRVFIVVLVLIFSLQLWVKADDIRDFEIEGMSIGDSLLDYMTKEEIIEIREDYYKDDTYSSITIFPNDYSFNISFYNALVLSYKTNDNKFLLKGVAGIIRYKENINECYNKMNEVINTLSESFPNINPTEIEEFNAALGKYTASDFIFDSKDRVTVKCSEYYKGDHNYIDNLRLAINKKEFIDWLAEIAYK